MGRFKGRSPLACTNCHSQKVKCTGHRPCDRCQSRRRECIYPARDPVHSIPESYLRNLQEELVDLRQRVRQKSGSDSNVQVSGESGSAGSTNLRRKPLDECSAERFVETLRRLSVSIPDNGPSGNLTEASSGVPYTYSRLNYDSMRLDVSFKLPPRPYAFHLLDTFEEGFCEYHWHLRKDFRERLGLTYSDPSSQAEDRNWLCRVSVVLALAETYYRSKVGRSDYDLGHDTSSSLVGSRHGNANLTSPSAFEDTTNQPPPGAEMFEQGLLLLKVSPEEPTIEDVEVLNLIAFYSYCLNRRKTAYFYAAQSVRLAQVLRLYESAMSADASSQGDSSKVVIQEHHRRTWWTTYCIDRITSTELGLRPIIDDLPLVPPSSSKLDSEDADQFSNPHLLFALAQLCFIKGKVVDAVGQLQKESLADSLKILNPCLTLLSDWMAGLPEDMSFTFEQGIKMQMQRHPYARNVASLYLRYNQCLILLLRPLLVRELPFIIRRSTANTSEESELEEMNQSLITKCVSAARDNAKILLGLWRIEKIAKYGYWESLHLFSSLAILSLSRVFITTSASASTGEASTSNHLQPYGLPETRSSPTSAPVVISEEYLPAIDYNSTLYSRARELLIDMGQVGNLSARDHERMLVDVEEMTSRMLAIQDGTGATPAEASFFDQPPGAAQPSLEGMIDEQIWYEMDWETIMRNPITWN
ncbi:fungal-specific transcription factor domain-containing protein [Hypoxylon rubiginosum]|uniref:Fungal-specific transcription factor domain-containing protein n=1 Tax=Hypoxylon rubiginosum TaxID=110542 RepID=A0ACC0CKF8_9PEZI|nr:fungal-specific transcription factor domain-containing protein [Hypoxylon rubiginosum]